MASCWRLKLKQAYYITIPRHKKTPLRGHERGVKKVKLPLNADYMGIEGSFKG